MGYVWRVRVQCAVGRRKVEREVGLSGGCQIVVSITYTSGHDALLYRKAGGIVDPSYIWRCLLSKVIFDSHNKLRIRSPLTSSTTTSDTHHVSSHFSTPSFKAFTHVQSRAKVSVPPSVEGSGSQSQRGGRKTANREWWFGLVLRVGCETLSSIPLPTTTVS